VPSPRVAGAIETVKRVVDTLDYLCTRGKLNEREQDAAGIQRSAWDMVQSSIGGQMDFELKKLSFAAPSRCRRLRRR
jgi:hypothetical protein